MISRKYGRTYHYPFSPGTTSDERINYHIQEDISRITTLVHTEKLDGENNCMNRYGVFARSHATPSETPWTRHLRERWATLKHELGDLEIFGENLYAIHSIGYSRIEAYFYVFAIREGEQWLSWEEVQFYANLLDFPTVPVLAIQEQSFDLTTLEKEINQWASQPSLMGSYDAKTGQPCTREGIVTRNADGFSVTDQPHNVFKYVRKGHVKTDQHWTRNWQRARLILEQPNGLR